MREIKFRACDKERGLVDVDALFQNLKIAKLYNDDHHPYMRFFDEIKLMQYTGLKDKNGVEIFEGDVVRGRQTFTTAPTTPSEVVAVVEYSERNTNFCLNGGSGRHDQFTSCLSLGGSIYQYEVIGNIYENPELLKESGASE